MKVHCFFEQSGTFKNEFKKLGHEAYDYDILNDLMVLCVMQIKDFWNTEYKGKTEGCEEE